jgi:hypothetical protein
VLRLATRCAALLSLSLLLAACGGATRLAYESGDAWVLVLTDRYLDLEGEQWRLARAAIRHFHAWHRRTELPRYAALLQSTAGRVERGLTRADVEWAIQNLRIRYAMLVAAAVRESAPLLHVLEADNIAALERRFAAEDRKRIRETLSGDVAKRERARVLHIVKRVEEWTGPLSGAQHEVVRRFVRATADRPRQAHEHRSRKQRELVALLLRDVGSAKEAGPEQLRSFLVGWEAERRNAQREYDARFVELILQLDRTLTASQRTHAIGRLGRYAEDCRQLSRGNSSAANAVSAMTSAR